MANTVHGPFVKGAATATGSYGTGVGQSNTYTSGNANNDETQSAVALAGINPDLLTPFVLTGATCAKDGTNANQLDIASGTAYLTQSDGTLARCDIGADNTHITSGATATWYLYLQPDGSWYWNTANTPAANSLFIAQVVTDASGNIATVTDERPLATTILHGFVGLPGFPGGLSLGGGLLVGGGASDATHAALQFNVAANLFNLWTKQGGATEQDMTFLTWSGSAALALLNLGTNNPATALVNINNAGAFSAVGGQASVGSFGVPVIVAQTINQHVTDTSSHAGTTIFTPTTNGLYRFSAFFTLNNGTSGQKVLVQIGYTDVNTGLANGAYMSGVSGGYNIYSGSFMPTTIVNGSYPVTPAIAYCKAGASVFIAYQDTGGTPNDWFSSMIERLA